MKRLLFRFPQITDAVGCFGQPAGLLVIPANIRESAATRFPEVFRDGLEHAPAREDARSGTTLGRMWMVRFTSTTGSKLARQAATNGGGRANGAVATLRRQSRHSQPAPAIEFARTPV